MTSSSSYIYELKESDKRGEIEKFLKDLPKNTADYAKSLFPIASWIGRYNLTWFIGDLIAGLTIGVVVIPQGMGYAKTATLPPEYGLYSSFVGVALYFLFSTSKDITIGPTSVMSLLIAQSLASITGGDKNFPYTNPQLASSLAFLSGMVALVIGLFRLGIVTNIISAPVIAGFTTGSAVTIATGQVPSLLGIKGIDTTQACYLVIINIFSHLSKIKKDAIMGLVSLFVLYVIKFSTAYLSKRLPKWERIFFFIGIFRIGIVVIIDTLISYLINKNVSAGNLSAQSPISVLGKVPTGFDHLGPPILDKTLLSYVGQYIPSVTLILILEHIAIAKSFGRINDYTSIYLRLFNVKRSGVRTPLAGIFTGALVLLALYVLSPAFTYIPSASLKYVWDFAVFAVGLIVTIFTTVEVGIYSSTSLALAVLFIRLARPRFYAIGRVPTGEGESQKYAYVPMRKAFAHAAHPPDGVLVFRFEEGLTHPNASFIDDKVVEYIKEHTRRMAKRAEKFGDRPWNDAGSRNDETYFQENSKLPPLKAVVFDMTSVSMIDSTGMNSLIDIKKALNKHAARRVEFHFANIATSSIQQTLIESGFGTIETNAEESRPGDLESSGVEDKAEDNSVIQLKKRFFHLSLEEAISAATNGEW
ncbi:15875_t:CDS:2 [Acaulospora colombiana]|uniref:15875_t:CDS:1 n=1 Tax=Acaulospora colombiana TaxID=27376 RepID=A0ACA9LKI1_9GLOM|nr:15875_t:CDS:2 [Acaulospora colombiana]